MGHGRPWEYGAQSRLEGDVQLPEKSKKDYRAPVDDLPQLFPTTFHAAGAYRSADPPASPARRMREPRHLRPAGDDTIGPSRDALGHQISRRCGQ